MAKRYSPEVRNRAKLIWLEHRSADEVIAKQVGVPRAETIRCWRNEDNWDELGRIIDERVNAEITDVVVDRRLQMNKRHDSLAVALEAAAVRAIRKATAAGVDLSAGEIRALASTLQVTQNIRRRAKAASESGIPKRD